MHTFDGSDGEFPNATLLASADGTLYSTTWYGGSSGNGTVFSLAPAGGGGWKETCCTASKERPTAARRPAASLRTAPVISTVRRTSTTATTMASRSSCKTRCVEGSRLSTHSPITAAARSVCGHVMPAKGKFYGTAIESGPDDGGVAFELVLGREHQWTQKVLHAFGAPGDGNSPYGGVVADKPAIFLERRSSAERTMPASSTS